MKICSHCGKEIPDESVFCMFCGTKYEDRKAEDEAPKLIAVSWEKFCSYDDKEFALEKMIQDGMFLFADESTDVDSVVSALDDVDSFTFQKKIVDDLRASGYPITEELVSEIIEWNGDSEILCYIIDLLPGKVSSELLQKAGEEGCDTETMDKLILKWDGHLFYEQIIDILEYAQMSNSSVEKLLKGALGELDTDGMKEILDLIDESLWSHFMPQINKLPFEERMEIREEYGI